MRLEGGVRERRGSDSGEYAPSGAEVEGKLAMRSESVKGEEARRSGAGILSILCRSSSHNKGYYRQ